MKSISELEQQIRFLINIPRKQSELLQDHANWNMLCSCLDTIGDTALAISAYCSHPPVEQGDGDAYLLAYGILQVLFVQQDAVENLHFALLKAPYQRHKRLKEIREMRNNSIGHPTKRRRKSRFAYNFISQGSLSKTDFQLMTTYADTVEPDFNEINIPSIIQEQREILQQVLSDIVQTLQREETEHRVQFRDQKLEKLFSPNLSYYFEKLFSAVFGSVPPDFGKMHLNLVAQTVELFKEKLEERKIWEVHDAARHEMQHSEHAITRLNSYFGDPAASGMNDEDAYIFVSFLQEQLKLLIDMAKEIDRTYEEEPA